MATKQNNFAEGKMSINILKIALPMTLAQLINLLYNIVDRIYIGQIPGTATLALTGVGLTFPIITMISAFANFFGMGGAPLTSIERGSGNLKRAEKIMGNSFWLCLVFSITLFLFFFLTKTPLLYAFGASSETIGYANDYITIYLIGTFFVMVGTGMNNFINAQGFASIGMLSVLLGAVSNIILDPILIFGLGMGVKGAAIATVISQGLSALWILQFLTSRKAILKLRLEHLKPDWKIIRSIIALGTTGFVMGVTNSVVQIFANSTLATFGGDLYVGVMTVLNSIREIVQMPANGITSGAQPVLGYNYGAKRPDRVKQGIRFLTLIGILYTLVAWGILYFFPHFFISIFNNDATLRQAAEPALKIYFFGFFMMSLQFVAQSVFVALGQAKQAVFFSIFRKIIIVVPLTLILPHCFGLGVNGVFLAEPISNFLGGLASFGTMYWTIYRQIDKEDQQ